MRLLECVLNWFGFERVLGVTSIRFRMRKNRVKPEKEVTISSAPVSYLLCDMSMPEFTKLANVTPVADLKFSVNGFRGGGYVRGSAQSVAANCYITITNAMNFFKKHAELPPRWARTNSLTVVPLAGVNLNAFYNRESLQFFYYSHPKIDGVFYTADSVEIVSHELGHAIFDAYRPETWAAGLLEVHAFHEAFADFTSMMCMLSNDEVVDFVINQTNGNLKTPNIVSNLCEHIGEIISIVSPETGRDPTNLRNAINDFCYVSPENLPTKAPINQLSSEPHSFSRIFLGAFYDLLILYYEDAKSNGASPTESLKFARDQLTKYTLNSIKNVPVNSRFFESMAKTLLWSDVTLNNRKYHDRMMEIFIARGLINPQLKSLSVSKRSNRSKVVVIKHQLQLRLAENFLRAQSSNILWYTEINVPNESCYFFDQNDQFLDYAGVDNSDAVTAAETFITSLSDRGEVGENREFSIQDGKLIRNRIS